MISNQETYNLSPFMAIYDPTHPFMGLFLVIKVLAIFVYIYKSFQRKGFNRFIENI